MVLENLYLILVVAGMVFFYFVIYHFLNYFFDGVFRPLSKKRALNSIFIIVIFSLLSYILAFSIKDPNLSNRVMHFLGGGFSAFLVCFRALKDSGLSLTRFNFFIISFLIVTSLGVLNELFEFVLESSFDLIFVPDKYDTWKDLLSNLLGFLLAVVLFFPFYKKREILHSSSGF